MYAVLGEIEFDVVAYWDEFESTMGVDYTSHARIEGKPGVQFIGDKLDKYGDALAYERIIAANPHVAIMPVLPSGVRLIIPVISVTQTTPELPPWLR
ncbi:TPA: hypothetical protein G8P00_001564 [Salmonella enterica]|uniref:Uncharacterized protein n=1 Tax=Salmonella enterica TaxID=28901 RepID=A0A761H723_SALER|nr:hypothetical protein [Salmonella enterica]HAG2928306.1 hypothetical protein [Salmonella enterica]